MVQLKCHPDGSIFSNLPGLQRQRHQVARDNKTNTSSQEILTEEFPAVGQWRNVSHSASCSRLLVYPQSWVGLVAERRSEMRREHKADHMTRHFEFKVSSSTL